MSINKNEIEILKELAKKYMVYANLPIQKEKKELWKALNRQKMQRPMVVIDQLPWNELNKEGILDCKIQDDFWKNIEWNLRTAIYKWENFAVDMVLDPFISIPKIIHNTGYGVSVSEDTLESQKHEGNSVVSHHFKRLISTEEDINLIKDMKITLDKEKTNELLQEAENIFQGIAPIKSTGIGFHLGIWDYITMLIGIEDIYIDLIDRPEFIHKLLNRMTESVLSGIKQANELNIHDDNVNTCHCSYIYTDELLPDSGMGKGGISKNCWSFGLAQLFTAVSPATTEEFELPYITRMAKEFGMIYYGCCDRLDDRLDIIKKIPNVKKISCSPWSDKAVFSSKIGKEIIISNKPNPAFLATTIFDEETIRKDLKETCELAKVNNANLEIILKDVSTVNYEPERLTKWAKIAMEAVSNY